MKRILILDLLVEREAFGRFGNIEIIRPFAAKGDVECLLLTPQLQSSDNLNYTLPPQVENDFPPLFTPAHFTTISPPGSPDPSSPVLTVADICFFEEIKMNGNLVQKKRILMPSQNGCNHWLAKLKPDAVICAGSRFNVSMWQDWMEGVAQIMRGCVNLKIPLLGICFGHQMLAISLGGEVIRAALPSKAVSQITLTPEGIEDPIFFSLLSPRGLFTHQDHVSRIPANSILLASAPHTPNCAFRICDERGNVLPAWGLQFHPEAQDSVISQAVKDNEFEEGEEEIFAPPHDGNLILANFVNALLD